MLASVFFLLPFFEVSCQDKVLFSPTGLQLATGERIDVPKNLFTGEMEKRDIPAQSEASIALALAVAAAVLALARRPLTDFLGSVAAGVGVWQLVVLRKVLEDKVNGTAGNQIKMVPKEGYTLVIVLLALGAVVHLWLWQKKRVSDLGAKNSGFRLARGERALFVCGLVILGLFYGGPFVLQATFNRRPSSAIVRAVAVAQLPDELHIGDWRDIKSVDCSFSRRTPIDWKENLTAGGVWHLEVAIVLRQKIDLYRAEDFIALARVTHDDSVEIKNAREQAAQLVSANGLPTLPRESPLFSRTSALGEENAEKVELYAYRASPSWLGWSLQACAKCWSGLFADQRGWRLRAWNVLPRLPQSPAEIGAHRLLTLADMPKDSLVVGEPSTAKAISDYNSERAAYVAAVQKSLAAQKFILFDKTVREEAERQVAGFYPKDGWTIDSMESLAGSSAPEGFMEGKSLGVTLRRTKALYVKAPMDQAATVLASSADLNIALQTAKEFFPALVSSWPKSPELYVISKPRGEVVKLTAALRASEAATKWVLLGLTWSQPEIIAKDSAGGLPASDITGNVVFLDQSQTGLPTPDDWVRRQNSAIADVHAEEKRMAHRYGSDRTVWRVLGKAFAAAGGEDQLRQVGALSEQMHAKITWNYLFRECQAEGSGSMHWQAHPFSVTDGFELSFQFKPLLGPPETVAFSLARSLDADGQQSETKNQSGNSKSTASAAVARFELHKAYGARLLWHLATSEGPFEIKVNNEATKFTVAERGLPEFQVEIDPASGFIRSVSYNELSEDGKQLNVGWRFLSSGTVVSDIREFSIDGKKVERYDLSDVSYEKNSGGSSGAQTTPRSYPTLDQVKSDLLGMHIGSAYNGWRFDSLSEFRVFTLRSSQVTENIVSFRIYLQVAGSDGTGGTAEIVVRYKSQGGRWVLVGLDDTGTWSKQ
jgi:hypothetical protein